MVSKVVYARDWGTETANGLQPELFDTILLCEGDSWMDRSSMSQLSLPWALEESFNKSGLKVLLVNLSHFGDTMVDIGEHVNTEFLEWVSSNWQYRAILVSAGGNDFIDAARSLTGQGILNVWQPGMDAAACFNMTAVNILRTTYLHPHFKTLVDTVRNSPQGNVKIYLNSYHVPVARNAPAGPSGPWLYRAYTDHGIPDGLWPQLTKLVFGEVEKVVQEWATGYSDVVQVPTTLANLTPAAAGSPGSSGDWANEIHPNKKGWRKLAPIWRQAMGI